MAYIVRRKVRGRSYFFKVAGYRDEQGKVKQKVLEYYGIHDPRTEPGAMPIVKKSATATYRFGDVSMLYHAAERIGMIGTINKYVPKRQGLSIGLELFLTAAHRLLDDKPSSANLQRWVKTTHLPLLLDFDPERITDNTQQYLMGKLYDKDRNIDHLLKISTDLYEATLPLFGKEENLFFYDVTSTYFEGRCCPLAKISYYHDGILNKLQINVGMVVNGKYGIPITSKVFEGDIKDTETVYEMVYYTKFIFGKEKGLLIMDRGMDSEDNIKIMDTVKYDYIVGLRSNHSFVEKLKATTDPIAEQWETYENKDQIIRMKKYTRNIFGKRRYVLIYYNAAIAVFQAEARQRKIDEATKCLAKTQNLTMTKAGEITTGLKKYIVVENNNGKIAWHINKVGVRHAEKQDGKFCLVTSKDVPAVEIFKLYFSKDKVEKCFRHMKQDASLHPTYKRLAEHVRADVFICHLAYLLLVISEHLVRENKIDVFWDQLSSETENIRLVEYQNQMGEKQFQIIPNNEIQRNIVDKLNLINQLPVVLTKTK